MVRRGHILATRERDLRQAQRGVYKLQASAHMSLPPPKQVPKPEGGVQPAGDQEAELWPGHRPLVPRAASPCPAGWRG